MGHLIIIQNESVIRWNSENKVQQLLLLSEEKLNLIVHLLFISLQTLSHTIDCHFEYYKWPIQLHFLYNSVTKFQSEISFDRQKTGKRLSKRKVYFRKKKGSYFNRCGVLYEFVKKNQCSNDMFEQSTVPRYIQFVVMNFAASHFHCYNSIFFSSTNTFKKKDWIWTQKSTKFTSKMIFSFVYCVYNIECALVFWLMSIERFDFLHTHTHTSTSI